MSLKVGELVAELGIDDSKFRSGMRSLPKQAETAGGEAGSGFADGVEGGAEPTGGKLSGLISSMGPMLVAGVAAVGALAGVALMQGITSAMDQEAATDKLTAQLGASEQQSKEYGRIAGRLYADAFGESYADVTAAIKEVQQNGLLPEDATEKQIESTTAQLMTVADILDQDIGMTSQAVGAMLRNGLAKDATEAFDILTRGVQQGADKAGDLMETFQEYSALFDRLGMDGATATGLLSQGLKAGARDADFVADALKEFQIRSTDASTASAEGYKLLGLSAEEMTAQIAAGGEGASAGLQTVLDRLRATEDPVERNAAAVALFGTKAEDLGDSLFALDPSTAAAGLGDVAGAADKLGEAYDNNKTKIESWKRQGMQKLTDFIGGTVIPAIEKFAQSKGVQEFVANFQRGFKMIVDWVTTNWPTISAVIGTVVQLVITYWKWLWLQVEIGIKVFTWLWQNVLSPLASWITGTLVPTIVAVATWLGQRLAPIVEMVGRFWTGKLWPALQTVARFITGTVIPVIGRIIAKFIEVASAVGTRVGQIVSFITGIPGRIAGVVSTLWNGIILGISAAKNWVGDRVGEIVRTITGIPGRIGDLSRSLLNAGRQIIQGLIDGINEKIESVKRLLSKVTDLIPDWKGPAERDRVLLRESGQLVMEGFTGGLESQVPAVRRSLGEITASLGVAANSGLSAVVGGSAGIATAASSTSSSSDRGGRSVTVLNQFHGPVAGRDGARWVADQTQVAVRKGLMAA